MTRTLRGRFRGALLALLAITAAGTANAQTYPDRPIRLVVPFAAGGSVDTVARLIGTKLHEQLGQQILIDNRTGAGGNIGTQAVVSAAPDGYTLLWGVASNIAINASLYKSLPYDVRRDLLPVALVAAVPNMLLVSNTIPANNVAEFVAYAKSRELAFASAGVGSSGHLTSELFRSAVGLDKMVHVPYKGTSAAYPDLISGRVAMMSDGVTSPMASGGKVRVLAVASKKRSPLVPDVPTMDELGIKGVDTSAWMGLLAPTGTPKEAVTRLNAAIAAILRDPAVLHAFAKAGADPLGGSPAVFGDFIDAEIARWKTVVGKLGIQAD
jgi:tripartite-type tricarboxylate transporter receptor subunit TctC